MIGHYSSAVRITAYLLTQPMLRALILYDRGWSYQYNVNSEWQIFEKFFRGRFIYSQSFFPEIYWEESAQ